MLLNDVLNILGRGDLFTVDCGNTVAVLKNFIVISLNYLSDIYTALLIVEVVISVTSTGLMPM